MRVLALDYGRARCGCAVSDPTGVLATPIEPVRAPMTRRGLARLRTLVRELDVERVVVGLPLSLSGRDSAQTAETRAFAARLAAGAAGPGRALRRALHDAAGRADGRIGRRGLAGGGAPARRLAGQPARREPRVGTRGAGSTEGEGGLASGGRGAGWLTGPSGPPDEREEARRERQRYRTDGGGPDRGRPNDRARKQPPPRRRRPAPERKHSWAGRIFALLALVAGRRADLVPGRAVPAVPRLAAWARDGDDPGPLERAAGRRSAGPRRRDPVGILLRGARHAGGRPGRVAVRHLPPAARHDLRGGAEDPDDAAARGQDDQHHDHRGPHARPDQRPTALAGRDGQLLRRHPHARR